MNFTFVTPSHRKSVLNHNLLKSNIFKKNKYPLVIQRGFRNISKAYNDALKKINTEYIVFLHHDVYLPDSWEKNFINSMNSMRGCQWGVLGVAGVGYSNNKWKNFFHLYNQKYNIHKLSGQFPYEVLTLDELMLVIKKESGLKFDEKIPSAHFYGVDICLQAKEIGLKNYVIRAFCHHNSTNSDARSVEFLKAKSYIKKKWKKYLPFRTTCTIIQ